MKPTLLLLTVTALLPITAFAAYQYDYPTPPAGPDPMTSASTQNWYVNGPVSTTSSGYTSQGDSGVISKATSLGTSAYEVKMQLTLTATGGYFAALLRASNDSVLAYAGTHYGIEVSYPTISGSSCTASLNFYKTIAGSATILGSAPITCHSGMVLRAVIQPGGTMMAYIDNLYVGAVADAQITGGAPGVGVTNSPAGNYITNVQFGHFDTTPPNTINTQTVGVSSFPNRVDLQWQGVADDANGIGLYAYQIYRYDPGNPTPTWIAGAYSPTLSDQSSMLPSTTYTYLLQACDWHWNCSTASIAVNTPPANATDPRRVGVRPDGSYWGGAGENMDMRSGNLNFTVPLLKAQGRGGWSVGFNLCYNSQNWRHDLGGNWLLGRDEGYGFGWKLLAGSITPYYYGFFNLDHFVFTDATGAEYRLDRNNGSGIWSTIEPAYVWYDANAHVLHFPDGSFWSMGSLSAGTEQDAGTIYPTAIEDTNGNQILISYNSGTSLTASNTSSRIDHIEDVRATSNGGPLRTYVFTYDQPPAGTLQHLNAITNTIGTNEGYTFTYASQTLYDPFASVSYGSSSMLQTVTNGIPLSNQFLYASSGEMVKATMPYGGYLRWDYNVGSHAGSRIQREIMQRYLSKQGGGESAYPIIYDSGSSTYVRGFATIWDLDGNAKKTWTFQTDTSQFSGGLVTAYQQFDMPSGALRSEDDYTWVQQPTSLKPYISQVVTTMDGTSKKSTQQLDPYSNVTQMQVYDWGSATVTRTFTNTYLSGGISGAPSYASLYILNRLVSSTVTDGSKSATLVNNTYDSTTYFDSPGIREHDANMGTQWFPRGNVSSSSTPDTTVSLSGYDIGGNVKYMTKNGVSTTVATNTNTNFAAPGVLTTNSQSSSLAWSSFLGLTNAAGPNGDATSIGYDTLGRPYSSTSPFGTYTAYTYNDTASPPTRTATTNSHWTRTTLDGFGRTIKTEAGDTQTRSTVQVNYAACGCSPLGKMSQQSQPYAPNGTVYWTTYLYDGMGRTTKVTLPDGSATNYVYAGSTVTVTDPAGHWKKYTMDAFGNVKQVDEPDPTLGTVSTTYSYDVLNHLTDVWMTRGSTTQHRGFDYTGGTTTVGAYLRSATNPENGTVSYTYNGYGKVATKADQNGNNFAYTYDTMGRLTQISANGNTLRTLYYDTNPFDSSNAFNQYTTGRLTAIQHATPGNSAAYTFTEMFAYQQAPAITTKRLRVSEDVTYPTYTYPPYNDVIVKGDLDASYSYDNLGQIVWTSYPATQYGPGPQYTYQFDGMQRPSGMTDQNNQQVVSGVVYGPASELDSITYLGYTESRTYNSLFQLTGLNGITYVYNGGANNGKISSQTAGSETINYNYDTLNRLTTATGSGWGQTFTYDGFGNLTNRTPSGSAPSSPATPADPLTNRLSGYSYDNNGNLITIGYAYDAENRLISAVSGNVKYFYDSQNKRIWQGNYSSGTLTSEQLFLYGVNGKKIGAYEPVITYGGIRGNIPQSIVFNQDYPSTTNAYFGGKLIQQGNTTFAPDRRGSNGKYFPYGEERNSPPLAPDQVKFATYTRDGTTGLDYADQRYYASSFGRFMTPDLYRASGGPADPQSWNRYSYTRSDPVNRNDPVGRCDQTADTDFSVTVCGALDGTGDDSRSGGGSGDNSGMQETNNDTQDTGGSSNPTPTGLQNAENGLRLFAGIMFSVPCANFILDTFGIQIQALQGIAAGAKLLNATEVGASVGSSFFPDNPDLAKAQQARADLASGHLDTSVALFFATSPTTHAAGQFGGNTIFFNPTWFSQIGDALATYTMFHETLHLAGLGGDAQIEALMGIPADVVRVRGSESITDKLEQVCGH